MLNRIIIFVCVLILFPYISNSKSYMDTANAKVTLRIVDEEGKPVEGAKISASYIIRFYTKTTFASIKGVSDGEGHFVASATGGDDLGFTVTMEGYYESIGGYTFKEIVNGRWEPWNPEVVVVMRKIEHPVPMYVRDTIMTKKKMVIPVLGKAVGFDLIEYDWVSPYGNGIRSDIIFQVDRKLVKNDEAEYVFKANFPGKFDGIQLYKEDIRSGSSFKLPRFAPEGGYQNSLIRTMKAVPSVYEKNTSADNNYFFRVRSEESNGKLVRAMYGKIQGDIEFRPGYDHTAAFFMQYFLNPDYTRNMEFNGNLFTNVDNSGRER